MVYFILLVLKDLGRVVNSTNLQEATIINVSLVLVPSRIPADVLSCTTVKIIRFKVF